MTRDDAGLWQEASQQEYDALMQHGVWELCELPKGRKAVACRWVYHIKTNTDGSIEHYKARLVAKGFPILITLRPLLLWPNLLCCKLCWLLLLLRTWRSTLWMSPLPS